MTGPLVLATRGSALALAQTRLVADQLRAVHPGLEVRELVVRTTGDSHPDEELTALGGSGVFTTELERALLEGRAHAAVHSLKDLPVRLPVQLVLGAVLRRGPAGDVLVSASTGGVEGLRDGARVGTGSPRRRAMFGALRRDARIEPIRGNVPTRLGKVRSGEFDAVILAAAGLERLGHATAGTWDFEGAALHAAPLPSFLPAPGQGAIAVEVRAEDEESLPLARCVNDAETAAAVEAERSVLAALGGGCHLALGALGTVQDGTLRLEAVLFDERGSGTRRVLEGPMSEASPLGREMAKMLHG